MASWRLGESSGIHYFVLQSLKKGNPERIGVDREKTRKEGKKEGGGETNGFLCSGVLVEIQFQCPHCGEMITSTADTSQGDFTTIEDCEVCCSPINVEVICEPGIVEDVRVTAA